MNTDNELAEPVGKTYLLKIERGMNIHVTVLRTRNAYGRLDCLVTPVTGTGQGWVSMSNLAAI